MRKQELFTIYARFYNSPAPINVLEEPLRFNVMLQRKKPHKRPGILLWNSTNRGTFRGNLKATFKF